MSRRPENLTAYLKPKYEMFYKRRKKTPMGAVLGQKLINAKCENISCCTSVPAVQPPVVRRMGGAPRALGRTGPGAGER